MCSWLERDYFILSENNLHKARKIEGTNVFTPLSERLFFMNVKGRVRKVPLNSTSQSLFEEPLSTTHDLLSRTTKPPTHAN